MKDHRKLKHIKGTIIEEMMNKPIKETVLKNPSFFCDGNPSNEEVLKGIEYKNKLLKKAGII